MTPAAFACCARSVADSTKPGITSVVCKTTVNPSLPAAFSSDFGQHVELDYLGEKDADDTYWSDSADRLLLAGLAVRNRSRINSTVGDDMLPNSANTARDAAVDSGASPSVASAAERMRGPPGWIAQDFTSPSATPF